MSSERKVGRPTKYKPEHCQEAIDFMAEGYSIAGLAGHWGVSRECIYNWAETIPEFSDALKQSRAAAAKWWEDRARAVAVGEAGSAPMVIFALKNRVSDEWRDSQEVKQTTKMDVNLKASVYDLTDEELLAIAAKGRKATP